MLNRDSQFDLESTVKPGFVLIAASGDYSIIKANHLFESAIDYALLHNKSKVLINVNNVTGNIPLMDRFYFAEHLANYRKKHALAKVKKIAVVGQEPIVHSERFGEQVAVNRGVNSRVFTNMTEAYDWLNET